MKVTVSRHRLPPPERQIRWGDGQTMGWTVSSDWANGCSWRVGGESWAERRRWNGQGARADRCPVSPSHPCAVTGPWVLTLWKSRDTLLVNARAAMSQWILKTLYLRERVGWRGVAEANT